MKTCDDYIELLSARLDGPLAGEEERELEAHLAVCPACRALEAQLTAIHAAFPELEEVSAPEGFAQGVMDRIRGEEGRKEKTVPLFRRPQVRALAGLAACAVLCAGLYQTGVFGRVGNASDQKTAAASAAEGDAGSVTMDLAIAPASVKEMEGSPAEDGALPDGQQAPMAAFSAGQDETDAVGLGAEPQVRSAESVSQYEAAGQPVSAVLTLPQLPEGGEALLGSGVEWLTDEEGRPFCIVTGEQMEALMALAEEQWQDRDLTEMATNRIGKEELCAVVLTGEP